VQKNRVYNIKEAIDRIQNYCSIQDRCQWEVERKLNEWGLIQNTIEMILIDLILEKYIDEQRFAESFCRGKFKIKKWGKVKIKNELKVRMISEICINKGMRQISDKEYTETLQQLFEKKSEKLKDKNQFIRKGKIARHLQQKGFESNLIWKLLNKDK